MTAVIKAENANLSKLDTFVGEQFSKLEHKEVEVDTDPQKAISAKKTEQESKKTIDHNEETKRFHLEHSLISDDVEISSDDEPETAQIPVLSCSAKNDNKESIQKKLFTPLATAAYDHRVRSSVSEKSDTDTPKLLSEPVKPLSNKPSQPSANDFLTLIKNHKTLFSGNAFLIAATIIALVTLASLPIGGLPVLAGLSVLAVAGITAAAVLLIWNVVGIIGNLIFEEDPSSTDEDLQNLSPQKPIDPEQPAPEPPGSTHHSSIYPPAEETEKENALSKPLPSPPPASDSKPSNVNT